MFNIVRSIFYTLLILTLVSPFAIAATEGIGKEVKKVYCLNIADFPNKGITEIRKILIENAKRNALNEIFGEIVKSSTIVNNFVLQSDTITSEGIGIIRIKGNPNFYNGKNFGEACVEINAYVTKKDLEKFKPEKLEIKNYCYTNPNIPLKDLKNKAREQAYLEIIKKKNPALKNITINDVTGLVQNFKIENEKFDFNTGAYCMDISGLLIPFYVQYYAFNGVKDKAKINNVKNYKSGDIIYEFDPTKYEEGDPLSEFSKTAVIMYSNEYPGNKIVGTNVSKSDEFTLRNLNLPDSVIFYIDFWLCGRCNFFVTVTTCDNQEYTIKLDDSGSFERDNSVLFPNGFKANLDVPDSKWSKLIIEIDKKKYKAFFKYPDNNKTVIGGFSNDKSFNCIKDLKLEIFKGVYYGKIKAVKK